MFRFRGPDSRRRGESTSTWSWAFGRGGIFRQGKLLSELSVCPHVRCIPGPQSVEEAVLNQVFLIGRWHYMPWGTRQEIRGPGSGCCVPRPAWVRAGTGDIRVNANKATGPPRFSLAQGVGGKHGPRAARVEAAWAVSGEAGNQRIHFTIILQAKPDISIIWFHIWLGLYLFYVFIKWSTRVIDLWDCLHLSSLFLALLSYSWHVTCEVKVYNMMIWYTSILQYGYPPAVI